MNLSQLIFSAHSPFAPLEPDRVVYADENTVAFLDRYPVSLGHTLVVFRRITASLYDLKPAEQAALWRVVAIVRDLLQDRYKPDGFNIGLNDGAAAGQTISHAHIHVIPRYADDHPDPRGGIRWIFPDKAGYWT